MSLQVKQLLTNALRQASDGELNWWVKRVGWLTSGNRLIDFVPQNRVYVDNVAVYFALMHRLDGLSRAQDVSHQLIVDDVPDFLSVVVISQKCLGEDASVVDQ